MPLFSMDRFPSPSNRGLSPGGRVLGIHHHQAYKTKSQPGGRATTLRPLDFWLNGVDRAFKIKPTVNQINGAVDFGYRSSDTMSNVAHYG